MRIDWIDIVFGGPYLALPPVLMIVFRRRLLLAMSIALLCVLSCWVLMIVGTEARLAFNPDYDSFAPALVWSVGWVPGAIYCALWFAGVQFVFWGNDRKE